MPDNQNNTEASGDGNIFADFVEHADFFGQPRGVATVFFTEFWERFSYYGMRALLVLFMIASVKGNNPGMGLSESTATAIYGIYLFLVYLMALPGGWAADKLWGARRAVFVGGIIITLGHFTMASPLIGFPLGPTFFIGLLLITIGTGLLKPNVSAMVGEFYPGGGAKKDQGYSIYYMGINFGAILGPTFTAVLAKRMGWHYGYLLAGIGMIIGLIVYKVGQRYTGDVGLRETDESKQTMRRRSIYYYTFEAIGIAVIVVVGWLIGADVIKISLETISDIIGFIAIIAAVAFLGYVAFYTDTDKSEKKKLGVILWLFLLEIVFWTGYEQGGSSLTVFAKKMTHRHFGPVHIIQNVFTPVAFTVVAVLLLGFFCYRIYKRKNLWPAIKVVIFVACAGIVIAVYLLSSTLAAGWKMPATMLQNIDPIWIVIMAPVFGSLWVWLAERNANPSIPAKFGLGLLGLAAAFFVIFWGAAQSTGPNSSSIGWLIATYFLFTCGELALSPVGLSSMSKLAPKGRVSQMMGVWFVGTGAGALFSGLVAGQLQTMSASQLFLLVASVLAGVGIIALIVSPFFNKLTGGVE